MNTVADILHRVVTQPPSLIEELNWYHDNIGTYWTEYDIHRYKYLMKKVNNITLSHNGVMDRIYKARAKARAGG